MSITENNPPEGLQEDSVSLVDLLLVLARRKRLLVIIPMVFVILGIIYAKVATPIFAASTILLPPQQQQSSASAMLSQLGGLAGAAAGGALGKNPNDLYLSILQSRSIGKAIVSQFGLQAHYKTKSMTAALKILASRSVMAAGKDGLISITVQDESPQRAADLANTYVVELRKLMKTIAVTEAQQRRRFFEGQLHQVKDDLTEAELAMKSLQEKTGVLQVEAQGRATIEALAQLRAQIAAKQVQLNAMRTFATGENPDYQRTLSELSGMQTQLNMLSHGDDDGQGALIVKSKAPGLSMDYVRKLRDVKYNETLFEIIAKQYEIAHMDEAKEGALIQVIDPATPPERKIKPKLVLIVLMAALGGIFVAIALAFVQEALKSASEGPNAEKFKELRAALALRRPKVAKG